MKKRLLMIVTSLLATLVLLLTSCNGSTIKPITIKDKVTPTNGNGTFLVETSDYVYYINGIGDYTSDNTFGKVTKSSLLRTKISDLGTKNAASEVVLPKLLITSSNETGIFIDGNYVYYATPNTSKDKAGKVKSSEIIFSRYNLSTGKNDVEITSLTESKDFRFVKNGDNVYLIYLYTETVDEQEEKHFKVFNANKENTVIYTSPSYTDLVLGDKDSTTIYFSNVAYNEKLEQAESFYNVYSYTYGNDKEADVRVVEYNKETGVFGDKFTFDGQSTSTQGYIFNLVSYVNGFLFVKQSNIDSTYSSISYYAYDGTTTYFLGYTNSFKDAAIASPSYVTLNDKIFSFYLMTGANLTRYDFDTEELNYALADTNNILSTKCTDCSILDIQDTIAFLYDTNGYIYSFDTTKPTNNILRLSEYKFKTDVKAFLPRILNNYIIGVGTEDYSYSYVYCVATSTEEIKLGDEVKTATNDSKKAYNELLLGKMTEDDNKTFTDNLDEE